MSLLIIMCIFIAFPLTLLLTYLLTFTLLVVISFIIPLSPLSTSSISICLSIHFVNMFSIFYFYLTFMKSFTFFIISQTGIGPRYDLERLGIPVLADLPVGHNLQDHIYPLGLNFIADASMKPKGVTWTYIQNHVHNMPNILQYLTFAKGPIASIGALEGLGFIRTRFANYTHRDWPDFQIHFLSGCLSSGK